MKIAIDCRYIGKSGIGRVCEGLLGALDFDKNEFYLIGDPKFLTKYGGHIVKDLTEPYSLDGLHSFDRSLNKKCDALFIPNFLIPFNVRIPVHTIMHDLAFLDVKETTRGFKDRLIKKILLKRCMKKSATIACVSEFTLNRCKYHYKKYFGKCYVNYNGISESVFTYAEAHPLTEKQKKIVYVGNVKPHKGLQTLLSAYEKSGCGMTLKIIGEREAFRMGMEIAEEKYRDVEFTGRLGDEELFKEIASASYLVLPSKYEGFGLPPLEALCLGTQPIVSDIPVFREVYAGLPVKYFRTQEELCSALTESPASFDIAETVKTIKEKYSYKKQADVLLNRIKEQLIISKIINSC